MRDRSATLRTAGWEERAAPAAEPEPPYYRTDGRYLGPAPAFYDVETLPWAEQVRRSWQTIRAEFEENVRRRRDRVVDVFNPAGAPVPGWRSVNFQTYLWRYHRARREFPATVAILDRIPHLTSAFINVLEPHSSIPAHQGDSQTIVRCHLGLDVPAGDCGIRVGTETRRCANGKLLAFSDAHEHASWNATDERRVILLFDVMRPEYAAEQRSICANVLGATAVIWLEKHLRRSRPFPQAMRTSLRRALGLTFRLWLPIQRRGR